MSGLEGEGVAFDLSCGDAIVAAWVGVNDGADPTTVLMTLNVTDAVMLTTEMDPASARDLAEALVEFAARAEAKTVAEAQRIADRRKE